MTTWAAAADQHGILTTADLRKAGLDYRAEVRLVRAGEITRLAHGWIALGSITDPTTRHVLTTRAMLRSHEGRAVATYHSALGLEALPTYDCDLSRVRLNRLAPGPTKTRPGLSLGRAIDVDLVRGESVHLAIACVQVGTAAGPLAALVAADAAVRTGHITKSELADAVTWANRHPQTARVTPMLQYVDPRHESPGETLLGHALRLMKIEVTPQVRIETADLSAIVDFLVDGVKVVIEFDGKVKYSRSSEEPDPYGHRRSPNDVVWLEKRREDRLCELGYEVIRVTWSELMDPVALAARIRSVIARSKARAAA